MKMPLYKAICVVVPMLAVGGCGDDAWQGGAAPVLDERSTPVQGDLYDRDASVSDSSLGATEGDASGMFEAYDCCNVRFAIIDDDGFENELAARAVSDSGRLPEGGVTLGFDSESESWVGEACILTNQRFTYRYEFDLAADDGGVFSLGRTNEFVEEEPLVDENVFSATEACMDVAPHDTIAPDAPPTYRDCAALLAADSNTASGVYDLDPDGDGEGLISSYCDMDSEGGGWTLLLSADLSATGGLHGTFDGVAMGTANAGASDFRIAADSATLSMMGVTELRVTTTSGQAITLPITTAAGFGASSATCNDPGVAIGTDTYWHAGRQDCWGSKHFGVSVGAATVEADTAGAHYGHFHRTGVDSGVYVFGAQNYINETEWSERYQYWLR